MNMTPSTPLEAWVVRGVIIGENRGVGDRCDNGRVIGE